MIEKEKKSFSFISNEFENEAKRDYLAYLLAHCFKQSKKNFK